MAQPLVPASLLLTHPLVAGLRFCFIASQAKDLVLDTTFDLRDGAVKTLYTDKYMVDFDGTDSILEVPGATESLALGADFSIVAGITGVSDGTISSRRAEAGGGGTDWELQILGSKPALRIGSDAKTFNYTLSGSSLIVIGASHADGDSQVFVNGAQVDSTSAIIGTTDDATVPQSIGARYSTYPGAANEYTGSIEFVYVWYGRKLTDEEQSDVGLDPYLFIAPTGRRRSAFGGVFRGISV